MCKISGPQYVFIFLVFLQITIKSSSGAISKDDVASCIKETKVILENQQTSTRNRFDEIKKRKSYDVKEHSDKKKGNLNSEIQKEKSVLATLKQSAIQDNYNVTSCNDSSTVFDLIFDSFGTSATAILAEYQTLADRNYTQYLFLVNQFALNYNQLQKKLDACQDQACIDKTQNECIDFKTQDDISDMEDKFSASAELLYSGARGKLDDLYQSKSKEVKAYSQQLMNCYKNNLNSNNVEGDNAGDTGFMLEPVCFLVYFSAMYKIFF